MGDGSSLPRSNVHIDARAPLGPLECWRHALSHGGINTLPLPPRVVAGIAKLKPRLIRIFIQESFAIYPDHGRYDWGLLDPFMDSIARTGAKVVAAITIKPPVLYPVVDQAVWRPNDPAEWKRVVGELVRRYSVEKPIVTHWEMGNETDIGEAGGSPYLIPDPGDYHEFYALTTQAVLEAHPAAIVGGPATCWIDNEPLPGLVKACAESGDRLDFISWHHYHDNPQRHASGIEKAKRILAGFPGKRPEMLITEWSKSFDPVSFEDQAFEPRRAASIAASALAMLEAGMDWSFYYHIWDQCFYPDPFRSSFSDSGIENMVTHWNRVPHRFGLFGVGEEVRPYYFVFQMLGRLGEQRLAARSDDADLRVLAGGVEDRLSAMLVNYNLQTSRPLLATIHFSGLTPGRRRLTVLRIDRANRWDAESLEMIPLEQREVWTPSDFHCQIHLPADSVAKVTLSDL